MSTKLAVDMSVIFLLGDKLYSQSKEFVFIRETIQNALDSHASRIDVNTDCGIGDSFTISVKDNGEGISDFNKYFLTIGGSSKRDSHDTIGGYGIAKLSIMAMDNWSIQSLDGLLTRQDLIDGTDYSKELCQGCIVIGTINHDVYNGTKIIKDFLQLTDSFDCEIYLNDELINPVKSSAYELPEEKYLIRVDSPLDTMSKHIIVRLNGLPQFYTSYWHGDAEYNFIHDVNTTLNAYDVGYPLTANRESFNKETRAFTEFQDLKSMLDKTLNEKYELQKIYFSNIHFEGNLLLGCTITKKAYKIYAFEYKTFSRYVNQLLDLLEYHKEEYKIGLTNDPKEAASYCQESKQFMLNPEISGRNKGNLLSLAIHEVTHIAESAHYESFTTRHTYIISTVLAKLALKEFRW